MRDRRYRIAWKDDDNELLPETWKILHEQMRGSKVYRMQSVETGHIIDDIPWEWLRPVERELPEPGHVWWRWKEENTEWRAGILTDNKANVITDFNDMTDCGRIEILPAHTTPPESENELTEGFDDPTAGQASRTISKDELFRRMDEHGKPTYARLWEELPPKRRNDLVDHIAVAGQEFAKGVYNRCVRYASLPTLRSAEEFTDEECLEMRDSFMDALRETDGVHAALRAEAAKAIDIAKRSTS